MEHADTTLANRQAGARGERIGQPGKPGAHPFARLTAGHLEAGRAGKVAVR